MIAIDTRGFILSMAPESHNGLDSLVVYAFFMGFSSQLADG
jgi:hypothetical protein